MESKTSPLRVLEPVTPEFLLILDAVMECYVELRYVLPILINLFFQFADINLDHQYPIDFFIMITITIIISIILFTSIKLPFNVHQIRLEPGYFSGPVAISMLASVFFPPSLFWVVYLILIITSPLHAMLFNLLKYLLRCLRSIPPLVIGFTFQRQLPPAAPAEVQLDEIVLHAMPDVNGIADAPW